MSSFWNVVNDVIRDADIVLEVVDARFIDESRNRELEKKIEKEGKKWLLVVNKADLVDKKKLDEYNRREKNVVFISATKHLGTSYLREGIFRLIQKRPVYVGVVGYPNTGKSSVINVLKGKHAVSTSSSAGFTKVKQKVRIAKDLYLIDTPGVLPHREKDDTKHALLAVKNVQEIKEPDTVAIELIELFRKENKKKFESMYGIKMEEDSYETLEHLAHKLCLLKKGGHPDVETVSRRIIKDWQRGSLHL